MDLLAETTLEIFEANITFLVCLRVNVIHAFLVDYVTISLKKL